MCVQEIRRFKCGHKEKGELRTCGVYDERVARRGFLRRLLGKPLKCYYLAHVIRDIYTVCSVACANRRKELRMENAREWEKQEKELQNREMSSHKRAQATASEYRRRKNEDEEVLRLWQEERKEMERQYKEKTLVDHIRHESTSGVRPLGWLSGQYCLRPQSLRHLAQDSWTDYIRHESTFRASDLSSVREGKSQSPKHLTRRQCWIDHIQHALTTGGRLLLGSLPPQASPTAVTSGVTTRGPSTILARASRLPHGAAKGKPKLGSPLFRVLRAGGQSRYTVAPNGLFASKDDADEPAVKDKPVVPRNEPWRPQNPDLVPRPLTISPKPAIPPKAAERALRTPAAAPIGNLPGFRADTTRTVPPGGQSVGAQRRSGPGAATGSNKYKPNPMFANKQERKPAAGEAARRRRKAQESSKKDMKPGWFKRLVSNKSAESVEWVSEDAARIERGPSRGPSRGPNRMK
ncbi:hypothetical protein NEMBOFW57_002210 [Staphylotrichum longicolle]|uniref:Uncharacterized protein n=1 Tax=Staphylotrichum longicolle TaxID=669026 RepID=A0AAD4F3V2_9PEZI|nr:hypothetical protein NEMBOFW57_002210 [Staphylotrichum longicolle]